MTQTTRIQRKRTKKFDMQETNNITHDIDDGAAAEVPTTHELVRRAIEGNFPWYINRGTRNYRWAQVMVTFGISKLVAKSLCTKFGFDPDELLTR